MEVLEGPQSARRDDDEHSDDEDGAGVVGSSAAGEAVQVEVSGVRVRVGAASQALVERVLRAVK